MRDTCAPLSIAALFAIARTSVAQLIKNLPAVQEPLVLFFGWEVVLEETDLRHGFIFEFREESKNLLVIVQNSSSFAASVKLRH